MSKLLALKEWLTLEEASLYISEHINEKVTITDLYRFSFNRHLTISIMFNEPTYALRGKFIGNESTAISEKNTISARNKLQTFSSASILLDDDFFMLDGMWDLSMLGAEAREVKDHFNSDTLRKKNPLTDYQGVFLKKGENVCQLHQNYEKSSSKNGSMASLINFTDECLKFNYSKKKAEEIMADLNCDRDAFLQKRKEEPIANSYFPSRGLVGHDYTLLVKSSEVTRFINVLGSKVQAVTPQQEKPLTSNERNSLLVFIGALCKEASIDINKRGITTSLVAMTEMNGVPLSDDTIRKILSQIEPAISSRSK